MYKVALIQNQSEMAHYGYADARSILKDLDYNVSLFTADNIDELSNALSRNLFDAVIFASNAFNDKTIRSEALKNEFRKPFCKWLELGNGCLCLHQLKLGEQDDPSLSFLPSPLNTLRAKVRPLSENSTDGTLSYRSTVKENILLLYPHEIEPSQIQKNALRFRGLPGLYWHYWSGVNLADWEILLQDEQDDSEARPLLLSARQPSNERVVVSALTLDWQKQRELLTNILTYVVEGRHNTALILDEKNRNTAFDYLVGTLQSRKYPFKEYYFGSEHKKLLSQINNRVHEILVLGPFVKLEKLPEELFDAIKSQIENGSLKLVSIESEHPSFSRFSVAGRERVAQRLLSNVVLKIQAELKVGHIDESFWSTAETLRTLESIPGTLFSHKDIVQASLELADKHDRNGSYDEVFGVTCALLWMRTTYLGSASEKSIRTLCWIRSRISKFDHREQSLAYLTLEELGLLNVEERELLNSLLSSLDISQLSEIDLVAYLRVAVTTERVSMLPSIISALEDKQLDGAWIDLATTANAVTCLVDGLSQLRLSESDYSDLKPSIEKMVFAAVNHIQEVHEESTAIDSETEYPWDGKASTTVKCIQAWLKFEELIDFPVHEIVDTLGGFNHSSTVTSAGRQALSVLEDIKAENTQLREALLFSEESLSTANQELANWSKISKRKNVNSIPMYIGLYILLTLIVTVVLEGWAQPVDAILRRAFIDGLTIHFGLISALTALMTWSFWKKFLPRKSNDS